MLLKGDEGGCKIWRGSVTSNRDSSLTTRRSIHSAIHEIFDPPNRFVQIAGTARGFPESDGARWPLRTMPCSPWRSRRMAVYYKIQRVFESQLGKAELQNAATRGALLDAGDVEREWTATFAGVRARMLAVPSRAAQRLPHLGAHDVSEIDREVRDAL